MPYTIVVPCTWKGARRALRNMQLNLRKYMRENLLDVAQQIIEEAAADAPQRTGNLAHSLHADGVMLGGTDLQIEFIGDAPYTVYMEEGFTSRAGRRIEGHHFIENAVNASRPELVEAMSEAMAESLKEAGIESE